MEIYGDYNDGNEDVEQTRLETQMSYINSFVERMSQERDMLARKIGGDLIDHPQFCGLESVNTRLPHRSRAQIPNHRHLLDHYLRLSCRLRRALGEGSALRSLCALQSGELEAPKLCLQLTHALLGSSTRRLAPRRPLLRRRQLLGRRRGQRWRR